MYVGKHLFYCTPSSTAERHWHKTDCEIEAQDEQSSVNCETKTLVLQRLDQSSDEAQKREKAFIFPSPSETTVIAAKDHLGATPLINWV